MKNLLIVTFIVTVSSICALAQKPDSSKPPAPKPAAESSAVRLPSAADVLEKYVKAIGGRDALQKFKTRYQAGTVELSPMGLKGTIESYARSDDRSLTKVSLAGIGDILDGYDGKTAWTVNPIQGSRIKEGRELLQTKRNNIFARESSIDKIYKSVTVRGIEKVGEHDTYVIVASSDGLPDDILYFDKENGLMLRSDTISITPEGEQAVKTFYDDYREVDGIKSAFKIKAITPAFEINSVITEVKYGMPIEDSKFVQPK
ncbi:MAG: hypothetical protein KIT61_02860 [Pyrinomonadaceae bacterium]|nr:hypothetical protein [Blastocatellia bacterium]MCW5955497.1 hypothetical protein [Pyrinomonadaceae bacterium]